MRRPSTVPRDLVVAALVVGAELPLLAFGPDAWPSPRVLAPVAVVASGVALLARRRAPIAVALALSLATTATPAVTIALFVALYTVGTLARREAAVATWVATAAVAVVQQVADDGAAVWGRGLLVGATMGTPVAVGLAVAARRQLAAERVARAVADERARIARELHDIVAHRVSLMVLHAGALELAPDPTGGTAAEAARIATIGREALDELREVVDVLRVDGDAGAPLAPVPGLADLTALVNQSRAAGLRVTVEGVPPDVDALPTVSGSIGRTVYRIVQEALTNVHRHAPGAPVRVSLGRPGAELSVAVVNGAPGRRVDDTSGGGHGLDGVRERVALAGGSVSAGPTPDGGWAVRATLPVRP